MTIGFVFSIKEEQFNRIFNDNKRILIITQSKKKLKSESKLLFYNPLPISAIVGEAIINDIYFENAESIIKLANKTILTLNELEDYLKISPLKFPRKKSRENKLFTVIDFKLPAKYNKNVKLSKYMVPSGFYITNTEYEIIKSKANGTQ